MLVAGILILGSWVAYRQAIYPLFVGLIFLPITYFLFPGQFLSFAMLLAGLAIGIYIWYVLTRQTQIGD